MPTDGDRRCLYSHLREYGRFTGLWWMSPEPAPPQPLPIPTVDELIHSQEFLCREGQQDQIAFLQDRVKVPEERVKDIALLTKGHRDNPL